MTSNVRKSYVRTYMYENENKKVGIINQVASLFSETFLHDSHKKQMRKAKSNDTIAQTLMYFSLETGALDIGHVLPNLSAWQLL